MVMGSESCVQRERIYHITFLRHSVMSGNVKGGVEWTAHDEWEVFASGGIEEGCKPDAMPKGLCVTPILLESTSNLTLEANVVIRDSTILCCYLELENKYS